MTNWIVYEFQKKKNQTQRQPTSPLYRNGRLWTKPVIFIWNVMRLYWNRWKHRGSRVKSVLTRTKLVGFRNGNDWNRSWNSWNSRVVPGTPRLSQLFVRRRISRGKIDLLTWHSLSASEPVDFLWNTFRCMRSPTCTFRFYWCSSGTCCNRG